MQLALILHHVGRYYVTLLLNLKLVSRVKWCLVSGFPYIVKCYPKTINVLKTFLRSFENVGPGDRLSVPKNTPVMNQGSQVIVCPPTSLSLKEAAMTSSYYHRIAHSAKETTQCPSLGVRLALWRFAVESDTPRCRQREPVLVGLYHATPFVARPTNDGCSTSCDNWQNIRVSTPAHRTDRHCVYCISYKCHNVTWIFNGTCQNARICTYTSKVNRWVKREVNDTVTKS